MDQTQAGRNYKTIMYRIHKSPAIFQTLPRVIYKTLISAALRIPYGNMSQIYFHNIGNQLFLPNQVFSVRSKYAPAEFFLMWGLWRGYFVLME